MKRGGVKTLAGVTGRQGASVVVACQRVMYRMASLGFSIALTPLIIHGVVGTFRLPLEL